MIELFLILALLGLVIAYSAYTAGRVDRLERDFIALEDSLTGDKNIS